MIRALLRLPFDFWQMIVTYLPGSIGRALRYRHWRRKLKHMGRHVRIDPGVYFQNPQCISINDNCWIDRGVIILAGRDRSSRPRRLIENDRFPCYPGEVYIGHSVHISPFSIISGIGGVYISDECGLSAGARLYSFSNHYRSDQFPDDRSFHFGPLVDHQRQFMIEGPIFLGKNVGVALGAIILPGVSIGQNSFIGIGSVVSTSFAENSLIAGNPAKSIRERFQNVNKE